MKDQTVCVCPPEISHEGFASLATPTYRASTIAFENSAAYASRAERGDKGYVYGLHGTPTTRTLEAAISALEGAKYTMVQPSGQAAISLVFLALLKPGDTVLVPDCAYPPVSMLCNGYLAERGIHHRVYDPLIGADIDGLLDDSVKLVWVESPGSATMEVQDLPAIAGAARAKGIPVAIDNTWASPLHFKPLNFDADIVVEALTKYFGGHSDLLMGSVSVNDDALHAKLKSTLHMLGIGVSPDDCSLVLRGMETMAVRLKHASEVALDFATRMAKRMDPKRVLHPALPSHPQHEMWKRDFAGASALFSIVVPADRADELNRLIDQAKTFSIGASWGGTHSLMVPMAIGEMRQFEGNAPDGLVLRLSIGMEDPEDLWADLEPIVEMVGQAEGR
ncbi:PLP-dependent aspartate aminotransferase family protein [Thalassospira sp. TSL5-1]|uniref:trans-sulfuration enzyme family protein n=1 Tax=Thalassospira sp. TSL5-1 TaxID=1544451 RepID=UPI00093CB0CA|nr:aminotransferase class I/II-fold pyridoxal phosphate-dependent enzyme [Thalassospira sp. TSL5-1]OKH87897.1 cystathionine beta-lyase [Thalassospira sp. TSL5-1]